VTDLVKSANCKIENRTKKSNHTSLVMNTSNGETGKKVSSPFLSCLTERNRAISSYVPKDSHMQLKNDLQTRVFKINQEIAM
jgi:hypothetical protein